MIDLDRKVSDSELRWFGVILPTVFAIFGGIVLWRTESMDAAIALWSIGAVLGVVYVALAPLRRLIYRGWMRAFAPIGWIVTHLVLGLIFYLILTPLGLFMRLIRRPLMPRTFDPKMESYWLPHEAGDTKRYFRQF